MKRFLVLFMLLAPLSIMAHEGHGISGSEVLHLLVSHYYAVIAFALVIAGSFYFSKKLRSKE